MLYSEDDGRKKDEILFSQAFYEYVNTGIESPRYVGYKEFETHEFSALL